jgi:hypothetical protein
MSQIASGSQDNARNTELGAIPADVMLMAIPTEPDMLYKVCSQDARDVSPQKRELIARLFTNTRRY